jgi:hypothetical protein
MTEINNLKGKSGSQYHSKLSQLRHLIDETKKEQLVKNLETKRLHNEQADILMEHWMNQQVNEQLKSIGLNNLSKHKQFDCSLNELIGNFSRNKNSSQEITKILVMALLEIWTRKIPFIPQNLLVHLSSLAFNYYYDERQTIFKLSNFLLSEDAQAILEILITRESKVTRSPLKQKIVILHLFFDILWGSRIIPYFQNKLLINTKEID